jgi:hypothetical protein
MPASLRLVSIFFGNIVSLRFYLLIYLLISCEGARGSGVRPGPGRAETQEGIGRDREKVIITSFRLYILNQNAVLSLAGIMAF